MCLQVFLFFLQYINMDKFLINDKLNERGCKHCAAFFITKPKVNFDLNKPISGDKETIDRNGTITFIQHEDKIYGVTCKHVVDILRKRNESLDEKEQYVFATLTKDTYFQIDRPNKFIFPAFKYRKTDIAICELRLDFLKAIEKEPIIIEVCPHDCLEKITHAFAFGFPEETVTQKEIKETGHRWVMPCIFALAENRAEGNIEENSRIYLYSELNKELCIKDLSGLSGGPVYWSNEKGYGILAIVSHASTPALTPESIANKHKISILAEIITKNRFVEWIRDLKS